MQNAARSVGNYFGGGGGLGRLATTTAGAALGAHLAPGTEMGAVLGATVPTALGMSAKGLENALARRALTGVDEAVRSRSPLAQSLPSLPALGSSNAYLRPLAFVPTPQPAPRAPAPMMPSRPPPVPMTPSLAQFLARGGA